MKQSFVLCCLVCLFFSLFIGRVEAQDTISFNLHNWLADAYMKHADRVYSNTITREGISILHYKKKDSIPDYYNYIKQVDRDHNNPIKKSNWGEHPAPVFLRDLKGTKVLVSASPDFRKYCEFPIDTEGCATIYNLVPQTIYWYKTVSANSAVVYNGVFKTQGTLRMISVENVLNIRDLGGWKCGSSSHIAYGKLYRGATMDGVHDFIPKAEQLKISTSDAQMMANWVGIKAEGDLRGSGYVLGLIPGTKENSKAFPAMGYKEMVTNEGNVPYTNEKNYSVIQKCLNFIANNLKNEKPTYFHCEWGADRTGSLAMIIEAICGVCERDLVKDWELTSFANYYDYKIISDEDLDSKGNIIKYPITMREMFSTLYKDYGGASGKNIQQQVIKWLKEKVYKTKISGGLTADEVISILQTYLVEDDQLSPKLIRDWSDKCQEFKYSVVTDEQKEVYSTPNKYFKTDGSLADSDMCCVSGWIISTGYSQLLVNVKCRLVAVCYDENKKQIGTLTNDVTEGTVIMENIDYELPKGTKYIRFNIPKYSGWSAVLSNQKYLN